MPKKGRRTPAQRAQSAQNLDKIHSARKENISPTTSLVKSELTIAFQRVEKEKSRGDDYKRRNNNEHRKQVRSEGVVRKLKAMAAEQTKAAASAEAQLELVKSECDTLAKKGAILEEKNIVLKKQKETLRKARERAAGKKEAAIAQSKRVKLKEKGIISESSRDIIRELIKLGVPVDHVDAVLQAIAESLGIVIKDHVSARSVSRIILEGGVAAKLQLAHMIINTDSMCDY